MFHRRISDQTNVAGVNATGLGGKISSSPSWLPRLASVDGIPVALGVVHLAGRL